MLTGLLRRLITEFIAHPEDLEINLKRFQNIVSISWRGHRTDTSRMIGTAGATYQSLRAYVKLVGEQHGYYVDLERVQDPIVGNMERYEPFKANPNWRKAEIMELFREAVRAGCRHDVVQVESGDVGENRTGLCAYICKLETLSTETILRTQLKHIFGVIGNPNGRVLLVEISRTLEPEAPQPKAADGRYARTQ